MKKCSITFLILLATALLGAVGIQEQMSSDTIRIKTAETEQEFFTRSVQEFSDQLFFAKEFEKENSMLSPLSVLLALGMTTNGADGSTLSSMLDVLVSKKGTLEQLNEANSTYLDSIQNLNDVELSIANSLWLNKLMLFDQTFLNKTRNVYHASANTLDFSAKSSLTAINDWVNVATRGTIPTILDGIDPASLMYLINAVYFKGDWMLPFTKESTYEQDFFLEGKSVGVPFMHQSVQLPYAKAMDAQMLLMPYTNSRFALVAVLPPADTDLSSWLATQKEEGTFTKRLFATMDSLQETRMELAFPKFESSYKDSLVDELKAMGMRKPFDAMQADFSRMTENRSKELVIGEVLHKTFIRVDEKGSEAAAVTSVMIKMTSMPIREQLELTFDRPFFYAIIDREARIPLFMGTMENPLEE